MSVNIEGNRPLPADWMIHKHAGRFLEVEHWLRATEFSKIVGVYEANQEIYHFLHHTECTNEQWLYLRSNLSECFHKLRSSVHDSRKVLVPLMSTIETKYHCGWKNPEEHIRDALLDLLSPNYRSLEVLEQLQGIGDIWKQLRAPFAYLEVQKRYGTILMEPVYRRIADLVVKLDRAICDTISLHMPRFEFLLTYCNWEVLRDLELFRNLSYNQ